LGETSERIRAVQPAEAMADRPLEDVDRLERMPPGAAEISVLHA